MIDMMVAGELLGKRHPVRQPPGLEEQTIPIGAEAPVGIPALQVGQLRVFLKTQKEMKCINQLI